MHDITKGDRVHNLSTQVSGTCTTYPFTYRQGKYQVKPFSAIMVHYDGESKEKPVRLTRLIKI